MPTIKALVSIMIHYSTFVRCQPELEGQILANIVRSEGNEMTEVIIALLTCQFTKQLLGDNRYTCNDELID